MRTPTTYPSGHLRSTRRWVSLSYGEGNTPTLTLTIHPGEEPDCQPILLGQIGINHLSFGVLNVKGLTEELISKGVELAWPIESFTNSQGEIRSSYVRDPDEVQHGADHSILA